jgi:hypothetical protein
MAEPIAIKQIKIGTENHDIDAKYWGGRESSDFDSLVSKVDEKLDKQIFDDNISIDETKFVIKDDKDNIGLILDETGLQVKDVTSIKDGIEHVLTQKANVEYVNNYVNEKIFVGTMEQYNVAYSNGLVAEGALVIITEVNVTPGGGSGSGSEGDNSGTTTTAKLGVAVLGQMKLGQE